jgi:hypothetical protein
MHSWLVSNSNDNYTTTVYWANFLTKVHPTSPHPIQSIKFCLPSLVALLGANISIETTSGIIITLELLIFKQKVFTA